MGELIEFPSDETPRVLVAVDDELYVMLTSTSFVADDHVVVFVPASSLKDPNADADLWIGRYTATAPGRSLFFQTLSGATYEVDERRFIWRNGELVFGQALSDYGIPETRERGVLRTGEPAALLFMSQQGDGWHLRIRLTTAVILTAHLPALPAAVPVSAGWLTLARRLHRAGNADDPA